MLSTKPTLDHVLLAASAATVLVGEGVLAVLPLALCVLTHGTRELFGAKAELKKMNDNALALAKALQVVSERTNALEAEFKKLETKFLLSRGKVE